MELHLNRSAGIAEIWLTKDEWDAPGAKEALKPLYKKLRADKLMPAVFLSGDSGLYDQTSALLCFNRKRVAEIEARKAAL